MKSFFWPVYIGIFFLALTGTSSLAAPVVFAKPVTLAGDHDVITTGTLEWAINFGGPDTTVNGVLFTAGNVGDYTNFELGFTKLVGSDDTRVVVQDKPTAFAGDADVFASLSAPYKALLSSGAYNNKISGTLTLTLSGLSSGKAYTVQFFVDDSRDFHGGSRSETVSSGGSTSQPLLYTSTGHLGGVGVFVVATFTADGPTQDFVFAPIASTDDAQINAFQLRTTASP